MVPSNADAIALQWADLHGLEPDPDRTDRVEGHPRSLWLGPDGEPLIEQYVITGMAHGIPLDPRGGGDAVGKAGAHMLDVGLSSTQHIAAFFGIAPAADPVRSESRPAAPPRPRAAETAAPRPKPAPAQPAAAGGIQATIEKALRAAGLMR